MKEALEQIRAAALAALADGGDEAAVEALRVRFLGRKGELTTVVRLHARRAGRASARPWARCSTQIKDEVEARIDEALAAARSRRALAGAPPSASTSPRPAAGRSSAALHPLMQIDGRDHRRLLRPRLQRRRRAGDRGRLPQLRSAQLSRRPSGARHAGHALRHRRASCCAPTPRRCRSASWRRSRRRCASSCRAPSTATTATRRTRRCSTRSRASWWTSASPSRDLKGVLTARAAARSSAADLPVRLRPSFFPFTEPSAEVDIGCFACGGRDGSRAASARAAAGSRSSAPG